MYMYVYIYYVMYIKVRMYNICICVFEVPIVRTPKLICLTEDRVPKHDVSSALLASKKKQF